jgi:hypothetical protein
MTEIQNNFKKKANKTSGTSFAGVGRTNSAFQKTNAASDAPLSANAYGHTGFGLSHAASNLNYGPL